MKYDSLCLLLLPPLSLSPLTLNSCPNREVEKEKSASGLSTCFVYQQKYFEITRFLVNWKATGFLEFGGLKSSESELTPLCAYHRFPSFIYSGKREKTPPHLQAAFVWGETRAVFFR